jgi:serine phosphatase RsbU (regulator of sigma subunit)
MYSKRTNGFYLSGEQNFKVLFFSDEPEYTLMFKQCFKDFANKHSLVETIHINSIESFKNELNSGLNCNYFNIALKDVDPSTIDFLIKLISALPQYLETFIIFWSHYPSELLLLESLKNNIHIDIRDISKANSEWIEWVNYLNLYNHLNRLHIEKIDEFFDLDEDIITKSPKGIKNNLKKAFIQSNQISSKLQEHFSQIEKQNAEINIRNIELEKAFKKSSAHHIKLQKALLQNEQQRIKLEKAIDEIKNKNEKLQSQNEEIKAQRDHIRIQTEEIESQRDLAIMQRDQIVLQQNEIKDNIQYSSRIQQALLPPSDFLDQLLPNHFIINKPRDIVSGDFYWVAQNRTYTVIAVADCTGHGISGALMSMLGSAFLNEIVIRNNVTCSSQILELLRRRVIDSLHQDINNSMEFSRDGMDISVCVIDILDYSIEYSGANNPVYIIRKNELIELRPDKIPIGIHEFFLEPFTDKKVSVQSGDQVYMFSDGYADQFGGSKGKKLKYSRFKELLQLYHHLPSAKQQEALEQYFTDWKGDFEQVDDVLVFNFTIS